MIHLSKTQPVPDSNSVDHVCGNCDLLFMGLRDGLSFGKISERRPPRFVRDLLSFPAQVLVCIDGCLAHRDIY